MSRWFYILILVFFGCQTNVPNIKVYEQIPFVDGAEGVYAETISGKTGLIGADEWKTKVPYMIMIDPDGWAAIKKNWYLECRKANGNCNTTVDSIDGIIKQIDGIAGAVLGKSK